ncbi:MAG: ATP-binding protein, partial [bacterium]
NRFVEGLVELARIEAGEMLLRRRWGTLDEIIAAALQRAEPLTRRHQVNVRIEEDIPVVQVDPRAVSEVIFTLIDNAAKYSPAGANIDIAVERANEQMIQIAIENGGQTIPLDLRERVFEKFFRATRDGDAGNKLLPKGTGMGLAIAKGIVEAHGGRIWIEDGKKGEGTRVVFTLPIGDVEAADELLSEVLPENVLSGGTNLVS